MVSTPDRAPTAVEVRELLREIDQDKANALAAAFDRAAQANGATQGEAMWAIAMLQARVLASAPMGAVQVWTATRFSELVQIALPTMMLKLEQARREHEGLRPFDG